MTHLIRAHLLLAIAAAGCGGGGDGGGSKYGPWQRYEAPNTHDVQALWAFAPGDVWAGGEVMLHFDGTAFTEVTTPKLGHLTDFWGFAPNDLYAVTDFELLHWDGAAWTLLDFAGAIDPTGLTALWGTSGADLWLGDDLNGRVFHWDGTAWSTGITETVQVRDLWGVAGGPVFAGGVSSIAQWTGTEWIDIHDPDSANDAAGVWGFGAGDVWATSDLGTLARWDGAAWTDMIPADNVDFNDSHTALWGAAPDDIWAVGDLGAISHWNGASWTQGTYGPFPYLPFLSKVHGSSATDIWVAGRGSDISNKGVIMHHEP
jgi:hypothetical protein